MDITITPETINSAYQAAQDARRFYARAGVVALMAKDALKKAQAAVAMQGKLEGLKNEMMRESASREWCATEHALLLGAESDEIAARGEYEAAALEAQRVEALLRLLEIEAQIGPAPNVERLFPPR